MIASEISPEKRTASFETGRQSLGHVSTTRREALSGSPMEESLTQVPRNNRNDDARIVQPKRGRNVRRFSGRNLQRENVTCQEITQAVSATLVPFQAKQIAEITGGSIRAAQNVKEGLNCMSLTNFINAARNIPELKALAMELLGCEAETDPEFMRGLHHLINAHLQRKSPGDQDG